MGSDRHIVIFAKYGLLRNVFSDAHTNCVSEKFKEFYRKLIIEQDISTPYNFLTVAKQKSE